MTDSMLIGTRIKAIREKTGLTQEAYAKLVGTTRVSISRYEAGERTPDAITIASVCKASGVSADYILGIIPLENHEAADISKTLGLTPEAINALKSESDNKCHPLDRSRLLSEIIANGQFRNDCCEAYECMREDVLSVVSELFRGEDQDRFNTIKANADFYKLVNLKSAYINGTLLKATRTLIDVIEAYHNREVTEQRKAQLSLFDE